MRFYQAQLDSPLGPMIAIADESALYLLEFVDRRALPGEIMRLKKRSKGTIANEMSPPLESIKKELQAYFNGTLKEFKTPLSLFGSSFQQQVWQALKQIPFGQTCSYADLANAINKPTAFRAVANANGANQISIVIPCHRVINTNGNLGGYGGGLKRKAWLIHHECNV